MQVSIELERSQASGVQAKALQAQLTVKIENLKEALANETVNVENERNANTKLREELVLSQAAAVEAKNLQAQQSSEIERLKVALANETANVQNAHTVSRDAKLEAFKERLTEWNSVTGRELVDQRDNG